MPFQLEVLKERSHNSKQTPENKDNQTAANEVTQFQPKLMMAHSSLKS